MNAELRRGHCPTLAEPMQTGDGLLVRLNPLASGFSPNTLIGLCEAALRRGNGVVEVTSRGSFQIRGLTARLARRLADDVDALSIAVRTGVPVETGPLAGLDANEIVDPRPLAERIREDIAAAGLQQRLGPKVSVIVDGGGHSGLNAISADVRLTAGKGALGLVWRLASPAYSTVDWPWGFFTEVNARKATLTVLAEIAALESDNRARGLSVARLAELFGVPSESADREPHSTKGLLAPGILPLTDSRVAVSISLPFGHSRAETLIAFIRDAEALGAAEVRLAPRRTLLLLCPAEASARAVLGAAGTAGFVVDRTDPRTRIAACPGSPACASGHIPARAIAAEIAASMPRDLDLDLHISGCAKRCASPHSDGLTLLGKPDNTALILGRPGATPLAHVAHEHAAAALGRVLHLIAAERKPGVPDQRGMYRLGKVRIAQSFREED
jgi:precorrin-3B synthase